MNIAHACALCSSHATVELHSAYMGHRIFKATSWITKTHHWFADDLIRDSRTLAGIRDMIRKQEED